MFLSQESYWSYFILLRGMFFQKIFFFHQNQFFVLFNVLKLAVSFVHIGPDKMQCHSSKRPVVPVLYSISFFFLSIIS